MEGIEFFTSPEGQVYYRKDGQEAKRLTKFSTDIVNKVVTLVRNRFPECYSRLAILYKKNASQMVDRFVRCNFGEHDLLTKDIDEDIMHFEEVRCPLQGRAGSGETLSQRQHAGPYCRAAAQEQEYGEIATSASP